MSWKACGNVVGGLIGSSCGMETDAQASGLMSWVACGIFRKVIFDPKGKGIVTCSEVTG